MAIPLHGHLRPLALQARALARRGWDVRVASLDEARAAVEPLAPFEALGAHPPGVPSRDEVFARATEEPDFKKGARRIMTWVNALWPSMYDGALAAGRRLRPDLVVADVVTAAGIDVADALGAPAVINNPDVLPMVSEAILEPAPGVPLMHEGHAMRSRPAWAARLHRPLRAVGLAVARRLIAAEIDPLRAARGLPHVDPLRRAEGRAVLVNTAFGLEYRRPLPAAISLVGPMLDDDDASLDPALARWLDEGGPAAYVNLGTLAAPSASLASRIADGLVASGMRALWVLRGEAAAAVTGRSARLRVVPWVASQTAVLRHPSVRAFVSHCGVNSAHESVACGVPLVALPLFADQHDMAMRALDAGVARVLDKTRFEARDLAEALARVSRDPAFTAPMPALQRSFAEAGGVERAADLLEAAAPP